MAKIRIGLIGFGNIAKGTHTSGYLQCPDDAEIVAVADVKEEALALAREKCGISEAFCFHDYKDLLACECVDAVDICTPNYLHCAIAKDAIKAGKPFSVEKPVGMTYSEVQSLCDAAAGTPAFVSFSFRFNKHIRYMRELLQKGTVGHVHTLNIRYSKSSAMRPGRKLEWRFEEQYAGSGALGDFGSHMIDVARLLCGDFDGVYAQRGIVVKERPRLDGSGIAPVTTDDWCNILAKGVSGTAMNISVSRCATTVGMLTEIEIYGDKGAIFYSNANPEIKIGDAESGEVRSVPVPDSFAANQSKVYVDMLNGKTDEFTPTLADGAACQKILDAALSACESGKYVKIDSL